MAPGLGRAVLELSTDSAGFNAGIASADAKFEALKTRIRGTGTAAGTASGQIKGFGDGLRHSAGGADAFGSKIGLLGTGVKSLAGAFGIAMGAGAIAGFALKIFATADNIQDLSQKMGVSAEAAQRFSFAAKQGGADIENVGKAIVTMNRNLAEGDKSTVGALRTAGLSIDDLRKKKPEDAFRAIVAAIEKIPNPMEQTRVAMQLLGKDGATLLPAIRGGFLDVADSATVMSNETVQRLADAQQAWENLFNNLTIWSGEFLADVMKNLGTAMSGFQKFFGDVKATAGGFFSGGFGGASAAHAAYMEELKKSQIAEGEAKKKSEELKDAKEKLARSAKFAAAATGELTQAQKDAKAAAEAHRKAVQGLADEFSGVALKKQVDEVNEAIAKLTAEQKKNPEIVDRILVKVKSLVASGGLPLLSKEAHTLWLQHTKLHDMLPRVNADLKDLLSTGPQIRMEYTRWNETLAVQLEILEKTRAFSKGGMFPSAADFLAGIKGGITSLGNAPSLVSTLFTTLKTQAAHFGKDLGPVILSALTGGGDVGKSVGGLAGSFLGTSLLKNFGGVLAKGLGNTIGGIVGSMLPGLGTLLGSQLGALLGKVFGGLKTLGRNVARDIQDAFATEIGFEHLNALMAKLRTMGTEGARLAAALDRAQKKDDEGATRREIENVRKFLQAAEEDARKLGEALDDAFRRAGDSAKDFGGKAPAALQPLIAELLNAKGLTEDHRKQLEALAGAPAWQQLESAAQGFGIELSALGPTFNQAKIDDTAMRYARALMMFEDAGADMNGVLRGMQDELQGVATEALKNQLTLPASLEPWLRRMAEAGELLDENGNKLENLDRFTFTGTLEDAFAGMKSVLEEIRDLLSKGLPKAADEGASGIRDRFRGGFDFPIRGRIELPDMPRVEMEHLATGGIVNRATPAIVGEGGPEAVIPLSRLDDMFKRGTGTTINLTFAPVLKSLDSADLDEFLRDGGAAQFTDHILRTLEKNDGGGVPVSPVSRLQTVVGGG